MLRIAINGFGRIGKTFLRTLFADKKALASIEIVAINVGPASKDSLAHFFKYDTLMGTYQGQVRIENNQLIIDDHKIAIVGEVDPLKLPWKALNIDWVVDASGKFTHKDKTMKHCQAGAKKVLITAPAHDEDISIIPGVNMNKYDAQKHTVVSLGSCSTNALVPIVYVMQKNFGIKQGFMTSIHAYTNTQALIDVDMGNPRRNRAAALNIVPTTSGATEVIGKIFPELDGLIEGHAIRVPVAKVSLIDFGFIAAKPLSVDAINQAFEQAKVSELKGILDITHEELVSSDFSGNNYSVTIDAPLTLVVGSVGKIFGWYDNEWGYSERLKDFLLFVAR